jgi:hypothetical protein
VLGHSQADKVKKAEAAAIEERVEAEKQRVKELTAKPSTKKKNKKKK